MNPVNFFMHYSQEENHFTNGLISLLALSKDCEPEFLNSFIKDFGLLDESQGIDTFKVLRGLKGSTADAELSGPHCCIHFETKTASGMLDEDKEIDEAQRQVQRHLKQLKERPGKNKLVLLTPDDGTSQYVARFVALDQNLIQHLEWKAVYDFLNQWEEKANQKQSVFSRLVQQYRQQIKERIIQLDVAGVIFKVAFDEMTGVHEATYLDEMKGWKEWNTPRECQLLDGKGRKLILYDRTRKALTLEVEIKSVKHTHKEVGFPWTNEFEPETLQILQPPISLSQLESIVGFAKFGTERSPYRMLTQEQYRQLMKHREKENDPLQKRQFQ